MLIIIKENKFTVSDNQYKMLILDLDGTVLNNQKRIPEDNKLAIRKVINKGIKVVICSGRIFSGARAYAKELGIKDFVIACNGAIIKTMPENELIYSNYLNYEDSQKVINICKANNMYVHAYIGEILVTEQLEYTSLLYLERNKEQDEEDRIDIKVVDSLKEYTEQCGTLVSKLVIICDHLTELIKVREEISKIHTVEIVSSASDNIEVMNKGVCKGKALEILCKHLKLPISQTVAIGDNENDISLIESAGLGIAMGNAIPEVRRIAKDITNTNEEMGVARALEKIFLVNSQH